MTPEELLKPRYKVIADYPESPYKIGDIEYSDTWSDNLSLTDYPAIFKRLEWWEERDEIDYPEYVKTAVWGELVIGKVSRITPNGVIISGFKTKEGADGCYQTFNYIIPATESEYNEYINQNKK